MGLIVGVVNKNLIIIEMGIFCINKCCVIGILLYLYIGNKKLIKFFINVFKRGFWGRYVINFFLLMSYCNIFEKIIFNSRNGIVFINKLRKRVKELFNWFVSVDIIFEFIE